jgi:hypothetical protein
MAANHGVYLQLSNCTHPLVTQDCLLVITIYSLALTGQLSESELLLDWWFTTNQFVLVTSPLRLTTSNFIFQLNICSYGPYVTSSPTGEWICHLQLLLVLASAVIHSSMSRGTHDHILLSQIRDSPNLEGQVPVFISPRNKVARFYPQALGSFFVAFYDSQSYGGGIWPRLHTGYQSVVICTAAYLV